MSKFSWVLRDILHKNRDVCPLPGLQQRTDIILSSQLISARQPGTTLFSGCADYTANRAQHISHTMCVCLWPCTEENVYCKSPRHPRAIFAQAKRRVRAKMAPDVCCITEVSHTSNTVGFWGQTWRSRCGNTDTLVVGNLHSLDGKQIKYGPRSN